MSIGVKINYVISDAVFEINYLIQPCIHYTIDQSTTNCTGKYYAIKIWLLVEIGL